MLLEEQRIAAWKAFREKLPKLADRVCGYYGCTCVSTSLKFPGDVAGSVGTQGSAEAHWYRDSIFSCLRASLKVAHNCGDIMVQLTHSCIHNRLPDQITVTGGALRSLCQDVNKIAGGLCLICLDEHSRIPEHCQHRASLELWIENDPLLQ